MYINFWYPALQSEQLTDEPKKVRMLGQDFVLYRDSEGAAHCLSNTCTHRGASLAAGKIKGDCIQCPYHGWQFDGNGDCQRIPSLGSQARIPSRTRIDAYPVEERYGIVFAFLGDLPEAERPPIMDIPTYEADGWQPTVIEYEVPINFVRSMENGLDPAHNEFVHNTHGFGGEDEGYQVNELRLTPADEWGFGFFHTFRSPGSDDPDVASFKQASNDREAGSGNVGPNHLWTIIRFSAEAEFGQYMYETPIDEHNIRVFLINMRNMMIEPENDQKISERNWYVIKQDIDVLEELHPPQTPDTNTKEFMVPADKVILMFREKLQEWDAKGWRIDSETVDRTSRNTAYAIPSPARREHKGWVIDSIPLVEGDAAPASAKQTA